MHTEAHYKAYGLGWVLTDQNGYTIVSHTGGMPGMLSQVLLIPELNAGVVVLTNAAPGGYSYYVLGAYNQRCVYWSRK